MSLSSGARWLIGAVGLVVVLGALFLLRQGLSRTRTAAERETAAASGWQTQLNGYIDLLNQNDGRIASVHTTATADHPQRFTRDMSRSAWRIEGDSELVDLADTQALTFPPSQITCAQIVHRTTTDPALNVPDDREIVLLARHPAADGSGWVGHRVADRADTPQVQRVLDEIGCPLLHP